MKLSTTDLMFSPAAARSVSSAAGKLRTDEINAAWNDTSLWFAMTQPRSRYPAGPSTRSCMFLFFSTADSFILDFSFYVILNSFRRFSQN